MKAQDALELMPALRAAAQGFSGDYSQRYAALLKHAFSTYAVLLNAKQLREAIGGGGQDTAQRAIDTFRADLRERFSQRIAFDAPLPDDVAAAANEAISALWTAAAAAGKQHFDVDRAAFEARAQDAEARASEALAQCQGLQQRLREADDAQKSAEAQLGELRARAAGMRAELDSTRQSLAVAEASAARERQESAASLEALRARLAEVEAAGAAAAAQAAARFDRLLLEHREALNRAQRLHETEVGRLVRERDAARSEAAQATSAAADERLTRARLEQRLAGMSADLERVTQERDAFQAAALAERDKAAAQAGELAGLRAAIQSIESGRASAGEATEAAETPPAGAPPRRRHR